MAAIDNLLFLQLRRDKNMVTKLLFRILELALREPPS